MTRSRSRWGSVTVSGFESDESPNPWEVDVVDERSLLARDAGQVGPATERAAEYLPVGVAPIGSMRALAPTICLALGVDPPMEAEEPALAELLDAFDGCERLAHIVISGLGVATWKCHENVSKGFNRLAEVRQAELQSVLPATSAVNLATLVSGASPETHHINNREQALQVDTIFDRIAAAEKRSAVVGWAESVAGLLLANHSPDAAIAESNTDKDVRDLFIDRLEGGDDYVLAQLLDIDEASHANGPWGRHTHQAIGRTDFRLRAMVQTAAEHGYALLIHGDHGQHEVEAGDESAESGPAGVSNGRHQEDVRVPLVGLSNAELRQVLGATADDAGDSSSDNG